MKEPLILTGCCSKDKMPGYREYFCVLRCGHMVFSFIYLCVLFVRFFKNADSCLLGLLEFVSAYVFNLMISP